MKSLTHLRSRGEASRSPFVPVHDHPYLPSYHITFVSRKAVNHRPRGEDAVLRNGFANPITAADERYGRLARSRLEGRGGVTKEKRACDGSGGVP